MGLRPTECRSRSSKLLLHDSLGKDPQPSWEYPPLTAQGYANPELYAFWKARDPLVTYAQRLIARGLIDAGAVAKMQKDADALVETEARAVIDAPWPDASTIRRACEWSI